MPWQGILNAGHVHKLATGQREPSVAQISCILTDYKSIMARPSVTCQVGRGQRAVAKGNALTGLVRGGQNMYAAAGGVP